MRGGWGSASQPYHPPHPHPTTVTLVAGELDEVLKRLDDENKVMLSDELVFLVWSIGTPV